MLRPARLGLTLALRASGTGRFRALSALLTTAIGSAMLILVLSLLDAGRPRMLAPQEGSGVYELILPGIVGLAIGLPVLAAAAATGRMSERERAQRMARLQLLGMCRRDQILVGIGETLLPTLIGLVAGTAAGTALVPLIGRSLLDMSPEPSATRFAVVASFSVPLCLIAGSVMPSGRARERSLERARGAVPRTPGLWRAAVLGIGLVMLWVSWALPHPHQRTAALFFGGTALAALGTLLLPALLVRRSADVMVRSHAPVAVVAGRRLQVQPALLGRVLGGLVVGVVVTTAAQGLISELMKAPVYQAGRHDRDVEASAQARVGDAAAITDLENAVEQVGGIRRIGYSAAGVIAVAGQAPDELPVGALITTCEELQIIRPEITGCTEDQAAWLPAEPSVDLGTPPGGAVDVFSGEYDESTGGFGDAVLRVDPGGNTLSRSPDAPVWQNTDPAPMLFVPRALVSDHQFWRIGDVRATILADPRPDLPAELRAHGIDAFTGWTAEDFAPYQATIDAIRLLNLAVLAVGLGAFLLGTADLAIGRRREHARLRLVGTPVSILRGAHLLEVTLPLVIGGGAALAVGHAVAVSFVELGNQGVGPEEMSHLGASSLLGPAIAVVIGSVVIAAITSIGIGAPLRSDHIRQE